MGMGAVAALGALAAAGVGGAGIASSNSAQRKEGKANAQKMNLMNQATQSYEDYRPIAAQQNMNALQQKTGLLQPLNGALGKMYGADAQMDLKAASQNPFAGVAGATGQGPLAGTRPSDADPSVTKWTNIGFTPDEARLISSKWTGADPINGKMLFAGLHPSTAAEVRASKPFQDALREQQDALKKGG